MSYGNTIISPRNKSVILTGLAQSPVVPVDMFWSGETGAVNDAMSVALLGAAYTEKYPLGTWTMTAEALARMTVQSGVNSLPNRIRVNGAQFAKSGYTRCASTLQTWDSNYAQLAFAGSGSAPARLTYSAFIKSSHNIAVNRDIIILTKAGGGFVVLAINSGNLRIHADDGGSGFGPNIAITTGNWYFVTVLALRSGISKLRAYTSTGVFVGESTIVSNDNTGFVNIRIGRCDATGDFGPPNDVGSLAVAQLMVDHTHGIYPLGIVYNPLNYPAVPVLNVADSFDRADGALGANWTEQKAGITISGNKAVSDNYDAVLPSAYYVGAFNEKQYSEIVIDTVSNAEMVGVGVRCTGDTVNNTGVFYVARAGIARQIQTLTNGVLTNLVAVTFTAWAIGDTMRIVADGNFIGIYRKPSGGAFSLIGQGWLNLTHAAGNPGIMIGKAAVWATTGKALSWAGGNLIN